MSFFRLMTTEETLSKHTKALAKQSVMVSTLKRSHEQVYRLYCKSLRQFKQRSQMRGVQQQAASMPLVSQADACLQLDASLKMLKNY